MFPANAEVAYCQPGRFPKKEIAQFVAEELGTRHHGVQLRIGRVYSKKRGTLTWKG